MAKTLFFLLCLCLINISLVVQEEPKEIDKKIPENNGTNSTAKVNSNNTSSNAHNIPPENTNESKDSFEENESGTVIRGILVFVGISFIFVLYLACKTYRKKKTPIIKKYGIRGRRSDVEMRPLPLDDDEEDETVFDVGNLNKP